ncbi:AAA family ATPase [Bacteroides congonensis]
MRSLHVQNFGPIGDVNVRFEDLTILVGAQASGKSIFLQLLKLLIDKDHILTTLDRYNYVWSKNPASVLDLFFGEGMSKVWREESEIVFDGQLKTLDSLFGIVENIPESLFYVPAQRILSISDGRPKNFMEFDLSTPYVLRVFSEILRLFFQNGMSGNTVFPVENSLESVLQKSFNDSIFHDGKVVMDERTGQKKMRMEIGGMNVPFMTWSAGQKEFMPLLMAFYCLSDFSPTLLKREEYKYVVIEEPEMGLHPQAIKSVILQILELMNMGYKIIVSTHSPVFLEFVWAFNILKNGDIAHKYEALCEMFDMTKDSVGIFEGVFDKNIDTVYFSREGGRVFSKDITSLDAASEDDAIAEWGGLSQFSGKVTDIVSRYLNVM